MPNECFVKNNNGDLLSEVNGFVDEAFDYEREIVRGRSSIMPSSGRTLVIPLARSCSAARALVASLSHEQ